MTKTSTLFWAMVLCLAVFVTVAVGADQSLSAKCSAQFQKVTQCLPFVTAKAAVPSKDCCASATALMKESDPACLCFIIQQIHNGSNAAVKSMGVQEALLLQLPSACELANASISDCPKMVRSRGRGSANRGRGRITIEPEQPTRVPVVGAVETPESYGIVLPVIRRENWERLGQKKMLPTRWPDEACMEAMGIKEDVMRLLEKVGWTWMMTQKWATYRCLTMEFLSTLVVRRHPVTHEPSAIIFRLGNEDRRLTISELETIYHLKTGGEYHVNRFKCETYWRTFVEYPGSEPRYYVPKSAKGSNLRNPVLRYLHKVIANTIYGRKETGPIILRELYILTHMLDGTIPATGAMITEHFDDVVTKPKADIWIGGLITPIALHFEISVDRRTPMPGNMLLSTSVLKVMNILEYDSRMIFIQHDGDRFLLPNTPLTTIDSIQDIGNLQMATEEHRRARVAAGLVDAGFSPLDRNIRARHAEDDDREERMEEEDAYERGHDYEEEGREEEERPREEPETSRQGEERHVPTQRTLREEVAALRSDFATFRDDTQRRQDEMLSLMRQMHEWHVQQGHFPPPRR